jgi:uncharacterized protein (DUF1501 family)
LEPNQRTTRDAEHETQAILDYYFNHPNVPPFFANNMIQRFVTSNPSPAYVLRVATAFKTGAYNSFGTGSRGDLAATMAAVFLDDEATSPLSQKDPTFGRIREPLIKWLSLMRSMDFKRNEQNIHSASLVNVNIGALGQSPYGAPSVFGWFDYDYAPVGAIDNANLVAPEAKLINPTNIIKFINGAHSLIRFGLGNCDGGLARTGAGIGDSGKIDDSDCHKFYGYELGSGRRKRGKGELPTPTYIEDTSLGMLKYSPASEDPADAAAIVKELDQVLTGGRLDPHQLSVITAAYSAKYTETGDASAALKAAQLLLVVTPEFHSSAPNNLTTTTRPADATKVDKAAPRPYKAIIYMWLGGGMDSYNMLVPLDGCKDRDMYAQYAEVRTDMALQKEFLLPITASMKTAKSGQVCDRFGLHPSFENLHRLYNDGDALFFANAGMLTVPITKKEYMTKTKPVPKPLHGHNSQTRYTQSADGANAHRKNGILGRLNDAMTMRGSTTASYMVGSGSGSIGGSVVLNPETVSLPMDYLSHTGSVSLLSSYSKGIEGTIDLLTGRVSTSPLAETLAHGVQRAIKRSKLISEMMKSTTCLTGTNSEFRTKYGNFAQSFEVIARSIKANAASVHTERETYYLGMGGFDTHFSATNGLQDRFGYVDSAIEGFEKEMKAQGLWNSIVLVQASEFGRMLTSNGDGTGHGWGGHYFITGGAVKGGQILGDYPDDLSQGTGSAMSGNGRAIPTTSWDQIWNGIAQWYGVEEMDMDQVLPNRKNFPKSSLFAESDLFTKHVPTTFPTPFPTTATPTLSPTPAPTATPTKAPTKQKWMDLKVNDKTREEIHAADGRTIDTFTPFTTQAIRVSRTPGRGGYLRFTEIVAYDADFNVIKPAGAQTNNRLHNVWRGSNMAPELHDGSFSWGRGSGVHFTQWADIYFGRDVTIAKIETGQVASVHETETRADFKLETYNPLVGDYPAPTTDAPTAYPTAAPTPAPTAAPTKYVAPTGLLGCAVAIPSCPSSESQATDFTDADITTAAACTAIAQTAMNICYNGAEGGVATGTATFRPTGAVSKVDSGECYIEYSAPCKAGVSLTTGRVLDCNPTANGCAAGDWTCNRHNHQQCARLAEPLAKQCYDPSTGTHGTATATWVRWGQSSTTTNSGYHEVGTYLVEEIGPGCAVAIPSCPSSESQATYFLDTDITTAAACTAIAQTAMNICYNGAAGGVATGTATFRPTGAVSKVDSGECYIEYSAPCKAGVSLTTGRVLHCNPTANGCAAGDWGCNKFNHQQCAGQAEIRAKQCYDPVTGIHGTVTTTWVRWGQSSTTTDSGYHEVGTYDY